MTSFTVTVVFFLFLLQIMEHFVKLNKQILCVFYLMVSFQLVISTDLVFAHFLELYGEVCPRSKCGLEFSTDGIDLPVLAQRCCGRCSCHDDCYLYGSCCLTKYDGFQQGRNFVDSARYCAVISNFQYRELANLHDF